MQKILVLMSTYNGESYLQDQIESILTQDLPSHIQLDIFIRDDGSKDRTLQILQEYSIKHSNITYEKGVNIGVVASFFALIQHAFAYDYYALADQDDVWLPDKIKQGISMLQTLEDNKPALYASCSLLVDNDMHGKQTTQINRRGLTFQNVIIQNLMPGHAQIFNQKLADFVNSYTFDPSRIVVHDFWLALIAITFGNVIFDNNYHTYYRQHTSNSIGYGHGPWGWFTERIKRIRNAAAKDITKQDLYFFELYQDLLEKENYKELHDLLFSQKNFFTRTRYLIHANVYRQRKLETFLFYTLYLFGGYRIKEVL